MGSSPGVVAVVGVVLGSMISWAGRFAPRLVVLNLGELTPIPFGNGVGRKTRSYPQACAAT